MFCLLKYYASPDLGLRLREAKSPDSCLTVTGIVLGSVVEEGGRGGLPSKSIDLVRTSEVLDRETTF